MKKSKLEKLFTDMGITNKRDLRLCPPLQLDLSRIGYSDEGMRLTISMGCPYKYNAEVKLGRQDCEWLLARLQKELSDSHNDNMPA